mmetsp:Transcript_16218/g.48383  ORF Transcript_16218/g.48383 Transcript_16218/m.48383 type:complete len:151 (-) Transcript_16218:20-472(-)
MNQDHGGRGCFYALFIIGRFNHYAIFPLMTALQPFNPYFNNAKLAKYTAIGKYNVEKRQAKRHALRKASSMREHISLLKQEAADDGSSLLREPERHLAAVSARSLAAAPDEHHTPETALIHLDSIVAQQTGGDALLPEGEEVEEGVGTLC